MKTTDENIIEEVLVDPEAHHKDSEDLMRQALHRQREEIARVVKQDLEAPEPKNETEEEWLEILHEGYFTAIDDILTEIKDL